MHGENNEPLIIVDADAIIALSNTEDTNHEKAEQILSSLTKLHAYTLFPITAICEAVTVLKGRLNKPNEAYIIIEKLQNDSFPLQSVDPLTLKNAAALLTPTASKKNILFDAVIAILAKQLEADAIFSFDGWYTKIGLTLVSDFIKQEKAA
jgi:predicted nucleic acid-binding protein